MSHVELLLIENVLKTLMICEDGAFCAVKVVSTDLQSKHHCSEFEVVRGVIDLMSLELS